MTDFRPDLDVVAGDLVAVGFLPAVDTRDHGVAIFGAALPGGAGQGGGDADDDGHPRSDLDRSVRASVDDPDRRAIIV